MYFILIFEDVYIFILCYLVEILSKDKKIKKTRKIIQKIVYAYV